MSDYPEIAARFARDTAGHRMTIAHDDGIYRHLVFRDPKHSFYWFEIITTPGQLVFSGDGESFVFRRTTDMFTFFRSGLRRNGTIEINPHYWAEKLASQRDAARTYSQKLFDEAVARDLKAAEVDYPGITEAWHEHVESEFNTEYEEEARRALDEFRFGESYEAACPKCDWRHEDTSYAAAVLKRSRHRQDAGEGHGGAVRDLAFTFADSWEWQLRDFDWWFLWACHAIVTGIARYDRVRQYGLQKLATPKAVAA